MLSAARRHSEPARAGVLILRAWLEDGRAGQLRVRMVGRPDLERDAQDTASASTVEEALDYIRGWLERFAASGP